MSSSFIAMKVITNNGISYTAELDSGQVGIDVEVHDGTFRLTADEFEAVDRMADLFGKVYSWFFESLEGPYCAFDEIDEFLNVYGSGNITEIRSLRKKDIRYVGIFSREEYWDEPFGASYTAYDYSTKAFDEEHRDELPYSDNEDSYGDSLYERFLSESGITGSVEDVNEKRAGGESFIDISDAVVGEHVTIGGMNWTVIAVEGSNALVLADKCVGKQPYNRPCKEVTWENSTLRKWLNDDYYKKLSEEEKNTIVEVENENPMNTKTGVSGGENTKDRLFVLSLEEMNMYLPNNHDRAIGDYWRIRTPGEEQRQALVIDPDGSILDAEDCWVDFKYGVRPAAWVKH